MRGAALGDRDVRLIVGAVGISALGDFLQVEPRTGDVDTVPSAAGTG